MNHELEALREENRLLRDLCRQHEIDREAKEYYERLLTEIGRSIGCGHPDDRLPSCVDEAVNEPSELVQLLNALTADEGDSVRFVNLNPDFDGPNATVFVSTDFSEQERQYFGDTVIECLRKAVAFRGLEVSGKVVSRRKRP